MRDFIGQRDEDERIPVMMATTPASSRAPTSRRTSFSILPSANLNAASAAAVSQGSFVASFSMARDEQLAYLELARSQLPMLVAECSRSEKATSEAQAVDGSGPGGAKWKRIKDKKSDVQVWEKGGPGDNSSSGGSRKKTHGNYNDTNAHYTATTSTGRDIFADPDALDSPLAMTYAVRSAVRVNAPLDVVLKTLDCSAVTAYRSFTKIIYESLVADTTVLYHSQSPTTVSSGVMMPMASTSTSHPNASASCCSPSESLAVRWMVCRCNNPMVSDCDFCVLEYSKVTSVDDPMPRCDDGRPLFKLRANNNSSNQNQSNISTGTGRSPRSGHGLHDCSEFPSAYKILSSMETKSCPELLDSHRLTRCFVPLGGFLFYPTDNVDVTDVVFYMSVSQDRFSNQQQHYNANGSSNPFSAASSNERQFRSIQRVMQHMARGVGRIKNAVDAYTMSLRLEMLRNMRWVRNTERAECVVCYRRFHQLTRRRHHCRLCGDVICRDCSVYKDADLPTIGPTILRICTLCDLNELKASTGSAAATAAANTATLVTTTGKNNNNPEEPAAEEEELEEKGDEPTTTQSLDKKLTRKRSTTLNIDTTKGIVHDQEPQAGRRFTTVVDGKQRRELPEQAFSCSKADIAQRQYKWNTGGGGKPLVILSPHSAALYASKTGKKMPTGFSAGNGDFPGASVKAMTPTGRQKTVAPQDWNAGAPQMFSNQQYQPTQAKSCSKLSSTKDPFNAFTFRGKTSSPALSAAAGARARRTPDPENDRELDGIGEESDGEAKFFTSTRGGAPVHPKAGVHGAAFTHPTRVVKSGKLVIPGHEHEFSEMKKKKKKDEVGDNQQHELNGKDRLLPRKLTNVEQYEDILLTLCEQVSRALDCKYAALSLFTGSSPHQPPATSVFPLGQPAMSSPHLTIATSPLSPSPITAIASGPTSGYENLPALHFLKAYGGKKLTKVAANLMCCAPILELKDKLITRDALGNCNMFDFKKLPIVIGPQQVRFYAGIPLVDYNGQMVGAFAVFDSNMYQGRSLNEVLPTMEAFATVALTAIEDRKTDLELKSFLKSPLVDMKGDNQAIRVSEPVFHIDMDLNGFDDEFPTHHGSGEELMIRQRFSSRLAPPYRPPPSVRDVEYYKNQMEQLVRQAQETEAQMLENSMAMKRQGVAI